MLKRSFFFNCYGTNINYHDIKTTECVYADCDLKHMELTNSHLYCTNFTNCKFDGVNCVKNNFDTMRFIMNVATYKIRECKIVECIFLNELFKNCMIIGSDIERTSYDECTWSECTFRKCCITNSVLFNVTFHKCIFENLSFQNNMVRNVTFDNCTFDRKTYELLKKSNVKIETPVIMENN